SSNGAVIAYASWLNNSVRVYHSRQSKERLESAIALAAPNELHRRLAQPDPLAAMQQSSLARRKPPLADGDAGLGLRQHLHREALRCPADQRVPPGHRRVGQIQVA